MFFIYNYLFSSTGAFKNKLNVIVPKAKKLFNIPIIKFTYGIKLKINNTVVTASEIKINNHFFWILNFFVIIPLITILVTGVANTNNINKYNVNNEIDTGTSTTVNSAINVTINTPKNAPRPIASDIADLPIDIFDTFLINTGVNHIASNVITKVVTIDVIKLIIVLTIFETIVEPKDSSFTSAVLLKLIFPLS